MRSSLLILSSRSGNTKTFLKYLERKEILQQINEIDTTMSTSPSEFDTVILGTYTWGDGKIPKEVKDWLVKNKDIIEGKRFFLFGSGNSIYTHFCRAVDSCEKIIVDCGGDVVSKIKFEQRFKEDEQDKSELNTFIKKLSHNI